MTQQQCWETLRSLLTAPENELVEFKEAKNAYDFESLGRYFSALSNEANLSHASCAWLVFGVSDKGKVCGTSYRSRPEALLALKYAVTQNTTDGLGFINIHEVFTDQWRVLLFQIPPAPKGVAVKWKGFAYGRDGDSLGPLNEYERWIIEQQKNDWSEEKVMDATFDDLDPAAIAEARRLYEIKSPQVYNPKWTDSEFLDCAGITLGGVITRTALILLGKPSAVNLLSHSFHITWIKEKDGKGIDFAHFGIPYLLSMRQIVQQVQHTQYTFSQTQDPQETVLYPDWIVLEMLHNCVVHQNYSLNAHILIRETQHHLQFENVGRFFPWSLDTLLERYRPQKFYKNPFLFRACAQLGIISGVGGGIHTVFDAYRDRGFPLPDYYTEDGEVIVPLYPRRLQEAFAHILHKNAHTMTLSEVLLLDRVQKQYSISKEQASLLRQKKWITGRYPFLYLVGAQKGLEMVDSGREFRFSADDFLREKLLCFLKRQKLANREQIRHVLSSDFGYGITPQQQDNKIQNMLHDMKEKGAVCKQSVGRHVYWTLPWAEKYS